LPLVTPPATRILPFCDKVAECLARAVLRLPVLLYVNGASALDSVDTDAGAVLAVLGAGAAGLDTVEDGAPKSAVKIRNAKRIMTPVTRELLTPACLTRSRRSFIWGRVCGPRW
jgi:hypothetical protein